MTRTTALLAGTGIAVPDRRIDNHRLARIMETLGWVAMLRGDFEEAAARHQRALALWKELGFTYAGFDARYALGLAQLHRGRWSEAQAVADACHAAAMEASHRAGTGYGHLLNGMLRLASEEPSAALTHFQEAVREYEAAALEQGLFQALTFSILAQLGDDMGGAQATLAKLEHGLRQQVAYSVARARFQAVQAAVCGAAGEHEAAQALWTQACEEPLIGESQWYPITVGRHLGRNR